MPEDVSRPSPDQPERPHERPAPPETSPARLVLLPQEIPLSHPDSRHRFRATPEHPLGVAAGAAARFDMPTILACLYRLQCQAQVHDGLDYLQVFTDPATQEELWFIDDEAAGRITALLPEEY